MPILNTKYKPPFYLKNGHMATVIPSTFRKVIGVDYNRERINTNDGDFLDIDWCGSKSDKLIIISHGLEGSTSRHYVKGMAKYFCQNGWDALGWNCRSCSGEMNAQSRLYHHGETEDISHVIEHAISKNVYRSIVLIGFSLGGSMTLKYLGEKGSTLPEQVKGGVAFSVPVNLESSVMELGKRGNDFYRKRFLQKLEKKIRHKAEKYPDEIRYTDFKKIKYFPDFDNLYTAPMHGFKDAEDFYLKASANQYMYGTQVPTLLLNALNDPFLPEECYPFDEVRNHEYLYFEAPKYGGHVGFKQRGNEFNYMEERALEFVNEYILPE